MIPHTYIQNKPDPTHKYSGDPRGGLVPLGRSQAAATAKPGGGHVRVSDRYNDDNNNDNNN
jgi:hypothetical protein